MTRRSPLALFAALAPTVALTLSATTAQVPHAADDPNGIAIPYRFVHLVHSTDPSLEGTTAHLRDADPWLLYQLGRDLVVRQFTKAEGAYGRSGELSVPMYSSGEMRSDAPRFARDHAASCASCHSIPYREPGGGQTIASTGGMGRNTPHFYGAGLIEMIGEQIRASILATYDANRNGVIDLIEVSSPAPVVVRPAPGADPINYGNLSRDVAGQPQLNTLFRVWYLDEGNRILDTAATAADPRVAAFDFVPQVFGWGRGFHELRDGRRVPQGAEASTIRGIFALAADLHMGLQSFDPVQQRDDGRGFAGTSLSGSRQVNFGEAADMGRLRAPGGLSVDDPDGDGYVSELIAGDLDAAEFYMLHAPQPAFIEAPRSSAGRQVFRRIGCARCHVENWRIDEDRRLFRMDVYGSDPDDTPSIAMRVVSLSRRLPSGKRVPNRAPFLVQGIYTDFKHWDVGPAFHERRFDGSLQREHRTAPLWGLASTAPYGASGQFSSIDSAILAHAGAAAAERTRYDALSQHDRRRLLAFLSSLVLYTSDRVAADIDGDGRYASRMLVHGTDVGYERLDARFLFASPPTPRALRDARDADGRFLPLLVFTDIPHAYRLESPFRRDSDYDGFPDAVDPTPFAKGVVR